MLGRESQQVCSCLLRDVLSIRFQNRVMQITGEVVVIIILMLSLTLELNLDIPYFEIK